MKNTKPVINKVIGIGASAGGLDAIQNLFDHMPADTGNTFVIIQHLSPDFKSLMPELLSKHTKMPVFTAEDKQQIAPNCIYLNQSKRNLHIKDNTLFLLEKGPKSNLNLPIDIFFHTLGEEFKENAIGIILSGTGSDGSRGIKSIKENGGLILVQLPETAQFDGMPNAAIETGLADSIITPSEMNDVISKYEEQELTSLLISNSDTTVDQLFKEILHQIQRHTGLDLGQYKNNTLLRRLEKRLNMSDIGSINDYLLYLKGNDEEKSLLFYDFLIGVTHFFRDTEAFEILEQQVIPKLCNDRYDTNTIRVWVPGCSTGEEAYSIAILLDRYLSHNKLEVDFKIFATDISEKSLNKASAGLFPINSANEIDSVIFKEYFILTGDQIQIVKRIREKIVFSIHNLLKDPPFIRMDLISCRNLLIYLNNEAQMKIINQFQFSLNKDGYLFLGNSESLGKYEKNFEPVNSKFKVFKNTTVKRRNHQDGLPEMNSPKNVRYKGIQEYPIVPKRDSEVRFYKYISDRYSPSLIFIDKDFNILFLKGNVGEKLSPREGIFQQNIIQLVESSLASVIRNGVRRVQSDNKPVLVKDVLVKNQNNEFNTDLTFDKTKLGNHQEVFIIEFGEDRKLNDKVEVKNINIGDSATQRIEDLEYELRLKNEELQNVIEELETSNEELQSANEELMASNEELQSTNEELQSVNEELYTVNIELQEKNKELADVNVVINNLINATEIATLFLDRKLKIKKFNNSLRNIMELEVSDVGRSISSFSFNFSHSTTQVIILEAERCLETELPFEKQIVSPDESSFLLRINPFFDHKGIVDGVVITMVDVTELISTRQELRLMEHKYEKLFQNISVGILHGEVIHDSEGEPSDLKILSVNRELERDFGITAHELEGNSLKSVLNDPEVESIIKVMDKSAESGNSHSLRFHSPTIKKNYIIRTFTPQKGQCAAAFEDVTEILKRKETLRKTINRLNMAISLTDLAVWEWDPINNIVTDKNDIWHEIYQLENRNVTDSFFTKIHEEDREIIQNDITALLEDSITSYHHVFRYKDDQNNLIKWIDNMGQAFKRDQTGKVISVLGVSRDITREKEAYLKLENEKTFNESITQNATSGIYIYDLNVGNNTYMNKRYTDILGWTLDEINAMDASSFFGLFHPEDQKSVEQHMSIILKEQKEDSLTYRFKHKDGHWVSCYSVDAPLEKNEDGTLKSFIGSFIDIGQIDL